MDGIERSIYSDIRNYFLCCPFCGNTQLNINLDSLRHMRQDSLKCSGCGAKWHIYLGLYGFSSAKLEVESKNGKGTELLGKRLKKDYWQGLVQGIRKTTPNAFKKSNV